VPRADALSDSHGVRLPRGVHFLERGWLSSNNVLCVGPQACGLIDTGYVSHATQTLGLLQAVLGDRTLDVVANTHLHSDHCGGNAALQARFPGLQVLIPPGQAAAVAHWDPIALTYGPTGQECPAFSFTGLLRPGSLLQLGEQSWEVHAAPGHDPHSVVLFDRESRTLVSADALWERGFGIVFPELEGEQGFDEVASTLDVIASLSPALVLPGHGTPFTDVAAALTFARSRLAFYRADPRKHAAHAAKVLVKFKLLDWQQISLSSLVEWAERTPYFGTVRERWFPEISVREWMAGLAADLVRAGAAHSDGELLVNA
jgi:glyoxylase-like metal-dependent hydrolase (beta-lactamase superfamily II)